MSDTGADTRTWTDSWVNSLLNVMMVWFPRHSPKMSCGFAEGPAGQIVYKGHVA